MLGQFSFSWSLRLCAKLPCDVVPGWLSTVFSTCPCGIGRAGIYCLCSARWSAFALFCSLVKTFQFLWLAFLCWCSRGVIFPMCCPPVLIRSLHVAHTWYFSCCPPVSFYRSTWLSLVTSCRLCRFALAITCLPVETSRWVQRLECDTHCRVCNPRVESGRSLHSLFYGGQQTTMVGGSRWRRSLGVALCMVRSTQQKPRSVRSAMRGGLSQLSHRRLVLFLQVLSGLHAAQPATHVRFSLSSGSPVFGRHAPPEDVPVRCTVVWTKFTLWLSCQARCAMSRMYKFQSACGMTSRLSPQYLLPVVS